MYEIVFNQKTDVRLPAQPEQFWLRCNIRTLLDFFDHPYIRLYYVQIELLNQFAGEQGGRKFLVVAETFMTDKEPHIGTSQVLELEYTSAVGKPRLKSLTARSASVWLSTSVEKHGRLAVEVREAIQAKLTEFIQA